MKLDFLICQSIHGQGDLGGECSTKCEYFTLLSPGVNAFPPNPPISQKVDFFGILGNAGPNILNLGTARGKMI